MSGQKILSKVAQSKDRRVFHLDVDVSEDQENEVIKNMTESLKNTKNKS